MAISVPDTTPELSKYELLEQIGHGGMATVYRARDRRLGRDVAVKLIHPHLRENAEVAARFVSEARAVAMLKHPNIVEVYDISDEREAEQYLVVELIRGLTLRELLKKQNALPPEIAALLGVRLADALAHAHAQGVIHRDVKPENVLIEIPEQRVSRPEATDLREVAHAEVKLTDFGIAKLLDAQGVTSTGQVLGSPAHMAPEQIEGGKVGPTADVFGLGVLLYECVTGQLPFDGKNPAQVLRRVLDGTFTPADRQRPQVGAGYTAILSRALAKDPADRFGSIEELAAALRAELSLVGFADSIEQFDEFIAEPTAYAERFTDCIAQALARSGERARAEGRTLLAARQFNRALAYRPGNPELVRRVSALARGQWLKRALVAFGSGALITAGASLGWWFWVTAEPPRSPVGAKPTTTALKTAKPAPSPRAPVAAGSGVINGSAEPPPQRKPAIARKRPKPAQRRRPPPVLGSSDGPAPSTRSVRVIPGVQGGTVLIDDTKYDNWFVHPISLPVGEHTFEFKPKDPNCCETSPETVVIKAGDGVQKVFLNVKYRQAILEFRAAALGPGQVECAEFFPGSKRIPEVRQVRVSASRVDPAGHCTFIPDDPNVSNTVQGPVTLRAGERTFWP